MNNEDTKKPPAWEGAGVILENDRGEVLLLKRGYTAPWMPGKWNTPGGDVDPGEAPADTARREVFEEAGLILGELELLASFRLEDGIAHMFRATDWIGTPLYNWESIDMKWMSLQQAVGMDLIPGLDGVLRRLQQTRETAPK